MNDAEKYEELKKAFDFIFLMRKGGQVRRFHTEKMLSVDTNASHTYGVIAWALILTDHAASKWLLLAALFHDVDEQIFGDIPGPVKWYAPDICELVEKRQKEFRVLHGIHIELSDREKLVLKWADKFDLLITCYEEQALGNTLGLEMCKRVVCALESLPELEMGKAMLDVWLSRHPEHYSSEPERHHYYD